MRERQDLKAANCSGFDFSASRFSWQFSGCLDSLFLAELTEDFIDMDKDNCSCKSVAKRRVPDGRWSLRLECACGRIKSVSPGEGKPALVKCECGYSFRCVRLPGGPEK